MQLCRLLYYSLSALYVCNCKQVQLIHDTSRQQHWWILPHAVNTVNFPDDGRKHRPKHVELTLNNKLTYIVASCCRSQWPRGLRRRPAAARLLRSWVRIPPEAWIFVCCECCVLSGRGLCDKLITRPGESYRLWWVVVCDLETSRMRRPWPALGRSATAKKKNCIFLVVFIIISRCTDSRTSTWKPIRYPLPDNLTFPNFKCVYLWYVILFNPSMTLGFNP